MNESLDFPLHSAFLALPLEGEAKKKFLQLRMKLEEEQHCLSLQQPDTPHLTIQYWAQVTQGEYDAILEQTRVLVENIQPFMLQTKQFNTFSSHDKENVLFFDVKKSQELDHIIEESPWEQMYKPFHPHVTLARIKDAERFTEKKAEIFERLRDCQFDIPVDRFRFYALVDGIHQTPLNTFALPMGED
ncbi:RNA 2',3'-cyclic phosphodiesterase [Candidatus Peregrinibacteria bacterium CG10_big_fil_rev_8_21_14_0_10_49_16]|nr:MAG: RNA 2',3'-cyclic phosphodiesterase [Candidatus Peregrinibacteria bacterium CG22_combo_CG10-13_8_21_14_all_49_11]PIR52043.1 MAG: RNA 2',3'-cyclic phosphodiesterase [Candidatus Peregrinibacteria bacterium CG10_big_fil_rev_8_21_14_0_10_49_16]